MSHRPFEFETSSSTSRGLLSRGAGKRVAERERERTPQERHRDAHSDSTAVVRILDIDRGWSACYGHRRQQR